MSAKSARSARSGRFVSRAHHYPTETPHRITTNQHNKSNATSLVPTDDSLAASSKASHYVIQLSPLPLGPVVSSDTFNGALAACTTPSGGRPPTKISLEPNGDFHQTTNGVVTELRLSHDDVAALSKVSATAFDNALTNNTSSKPKEKDKRVLRSQGGSSRSKSNLARFFPDFEEIVFGSPREPELLTVDSVLFIVDSKARKTLDVQYTESQTLRDEPEQPSQILETNRAFQLPFIASEIHKPIAKEWPKVDTTTFQIGGDRYGTDPLSDAVFFNAHKRGERKEKQLRNIEKEHALHEKSDLERLFAELKGPDWLRAMGISGITETEKKVFEPHRDQYVARVKALLHKFRAWKEQEKELRIRREEALAAKEEAEEEEEAGEEEGDDGVDNEYDATLADPSARQLHQEAKLAARMKAAKIRLKLVKAAPVPEPPPPDKPFESFYSKPYLRAAALSNHRRGRSITAFGLPLPEIEMEEFSLPHDFVTDEVIMANARKRRRLKRESQISS